MVLPHINGDNRISPLDALEVINFLNQTGSGEGECGSRRVEDIPLTREWTDAVDMQNG